MTRYCPSNDASSSSTTDTGYWIECVPLRPRSWLHMDPGLYTASIDGLPDIKGLGLSPDRAIAKLQKRLEHLREERQCSLPPTHNHLRPPQPNAAPHGWMSVYVELCD